MKQISKKSVRFCLIPYIKNRNFQKLAYISMLVFLFITLIVLTILARNFNFRFEGSVDLVENKGHIMLFMSALQIYTAEMYFERTDDGINSIIVKKGKKRTEIHLNADKKDSRSIVRIANYPAFDHVLIKDLSFKVSIGKKDDAFFTTMILSTIRILIYSVLSFIKTRFNADVNERFDPEFNTDKLAASFEGIISLSIADIASAYIISKFRKINKLQEVTQN